jgi:hypothetical protein
LLRFRDILDILECSPSFFLKISFYKILFGQALRKSLAGVDGLEPPNDGLKTRCLTSLAIPQYIISKTLLAAEQITHTAKLEGTFKTFRKKSTIQLQYTK